MLKGLPHNRDVAALDERSTVCVSEMSGAGVIELCKWPWERGEERLMAIDKKLIDQLLHGLQDYKKPEEIIGENGILKQLSKAVLERALEAEMIEHLGYEKHDPAGQHQGNRNGKSRETLQGDFRELELERPRDRQPTFEPKIVRKRQTRWTGFDDTRFYRCTRGAWRRASLAPK